MKSTKISFCFSRVVFKLGCILELTRELWKILWPESPSRDTNLIDFRVGSWDREAYLLYPLLNFTAKPEDLTLRRYEYGHYCSWAGPKSSLTSFYNTLPCLSKLVTARVSCLSWRCQKYHTLLYYSMKTAECEGGNQEWGGPTINMVCEKKGMKG